MSWVVLAVFNAMSWFLARVLGPRRSIALGRAAGVLAFHILPIRGRVVRENLARAFPEKSEAERRRIARDCYRQLGRIFAEAIFLPRLTSEQIGQLVRLRNKDLIDRCLAQGKGLIFCMAHMGNWELIGYEGHRNGYVVYAVTKELKGSVNRRLHDARAQLFKELPPRNSFERGLEALGSNAALALIIDQHRSGHRAIVVDFFGHPAAAAPSPALFHLRAGAPVLTAWMCLGPDDVYDVWVRGPYPVPEAATEAERLQSHTQWLASDLESFIRQHPSEWYWVHRRWKVPDSTPVPRAADHPASPPMPALGQENAA